MERTVSFPDESHDVRLRHRKIRDEMPQWEAKRASRTICERLFKTEWYADCTWIYGYYPLGSEVDCLHFLKKALRDGKHVALPRTEQKLSFAVECHMDFYEITSIEQVEKGRFGVLEPNPESPLVQQQDAVVLVPGVAFDKKGNRYGYGKGYYDRYFARFPKLHKFALAYEHQLEEALRVSETDVRMDAIYTERQCYLLEERTGESHGITGNL